jgi:AcrR family transcriptional regulator
VTRTPLSRDHAVATAVAILDAQGAPAVTMRGVAREMGVPLMSLYRHVTSKDDLDGAIVQHLLARIPTGDRPATWETALRGWAHAYRAMVREHPNAAPLLASRPESGYGSRPGEVEGLLVLLGEAGLDPVDARVRLRAALVTIMGFCNVQAAYEQAAGGEADAPVAPDAFPRLAALVDDVRSRRHGEEVFAAMVDFVVAGLRASTPS